MGQSYEHLRLRERVEIELWRRAGCSLRWIGRRLGRSASTISRELRRNARPTKQWRATYAGERAHALAKRRRRWDARFKLARQPDLCALVRQSLAMGHSPEQIAGRLTREQGRRIISHASIDRFIYHRSAQKDHWHRLLPRPSRGAAGSGAAASARPASSRIAARSGSGRTRPGIGARPVIGRPTPCSLPDTVRPCSSCTSDPRV